MFGLHSLSKTVYAPSSDPGAGDTTRAMDLVSDGTTFTLLMPSKNRATKEQTLSPDPLTILWGNLRPNIFVDTIMIHDISSDQVVSVIHEITSKRSTLTKQIVEVPEYDLTVFGQVPPTQSSAIVKVAKAERVIHFSQLDLLPTGQDIYGVNVAEGVVDIQYSFRYTLSLVLLECLATNSLRGFPGEFT